MDEVIQPKAETDQPEQKTENHKPNGAPRSIIAELHTPEAIRVDAKTQEHKTTIEKIFWWVLRVGEIGGVVAVVAYTIITYQLWLKTKETAHTAASTLDAAREQTEIQRRSLAISSGAFFNVEWGQINFEKSANRYLVFFNVQNIGKQKASIRDVTADVGFLPSPPGKLSPTSTTVRLDLHTLDVQGRTEASFAFKDWQASDYKAFEHGDTQLYLWGEFHYSDGLGWDEKLPFCRYATLIQDRITSSFPCDCWDTQKNKETEEKGKKLLTSA